ncbi:hypothetical protein [Arthrobacter sp. A5]|uniref:hypothetical protein n=1 Tax=Arthrobacter sp. A5 TaxID=576926 RepID=UPI003DA9EFA9
MIQISVTIDNAHRSAAVDVVDRLRSNGMQVDQVLDGVGIVTGSAPEDRRPALEALEGVASVDEELSYQLPPPDSAIQ